MQRFRNVTKFGIIKQVEHLKVTFLVEPTEMESEGVRSAAMKGDSRTRALAMAGGRGRGGVMGPQNLEKKM